MLTPLDQVLAALQFYATGAFQSVVGNVLKLSQSSISRSVHDVSNALASIAKDHIYFNTNLLVVGLLVASRIIKIYIHVYYLQIKREFFDIAKMPGVIGCIDGTHFRISRPQIHEAAFVNRKSYHSINAQAICNAHGRFLSVNVSKPGSVHDSTMFKSSAICKKLSAGNFGEGYLLGDSGYGCTPFLLTPYADPSTREEVFYPFSL